MSEGTKRVLTVCTANLLRSPTAALVLAQKPYNHNTRSCGTEDFAVIKFSYKLLNWADEIVCMEEHHAKKIGYSLEHIKRMDVPIYVLNIPDDFNYMDPELIALIKKRYDKRKPYGLQPVHQPR